MEEEAALNEPLTVKKSTALTLDPHGLNLETFTFYLIVLMVLFIMNCLLALYLSYLNSLFLMWDVISAQLDIMYEPFVSFLAGIGAQLLSAYGSQALSIFGLCLILAIVMLIRSVRVTTKSLWMSMDLC